MNKIQYKCNDCGVYFKLLKEQKYCVKCGSKNIEQYTFHGVENKIDIDYYLEGFLTNEEFELIKQKLKIT